MATAVYFFQPLLWILSRRIEITAEEVCDDFVVLSGGDRRDYASRLVDIAELSTEFSAAAVAAAGVGIVSLRSMLARRVERIMDTSRGLSTRVGNLLLVAVLLCGVTGTAFVGLVGLNSPMHGGEPAAAAVDDDSDQETANDDEQTVSQAADADISEAVAAAKRTKAFAAQKKATAFVEKAKAKNASLSC